MYTSDNFIIGLGEDVSEPQEEVSVPGESFLSKPLDNNTSWGILAVLGVALISLMLIALLDTRKKK